MKILICGIGKSGTSALTYKIAGALPGCQIVFEPRGHRKKREELGKHLVVKRLLSGSMVKSRRDPSAVVREYHDFDRKIWIARDPRDVAISGFLYQWYRNGWRRSIRSFLSPKLPQRQFRRVLELMRAKEGAPREIAFRRLMTVRYDRTLTQKQLRDNQVAIYRRLSDAFARLGDDWHVFRYEDLVQQRFESLNSYLSFCVSSNSEVPTSLQRVVRSKASGAWRTWFTHEDVSFFQQCYQQYLNMTGYDSNDWSLRRGVIDPEFASEYMVKLYSGQYS